MKDELKQIFLSQQITSPPPNQAHHDEIPAQTNLLPVKLIVMKELLRQIFLSKQIKSVSPDQDHHDDRPAQANLL